MKPSPEQTRWQELAARLRERLRARLDHDVETLSPGQLRIMAVVYDMVCDLEASAATYDARVEHALNWYPGR